MTNQRPPPGFQDFRPGAQQAEPPGVHKVQPAPGPPQRRSGGPKKAIRKRSSGFGTILLVLGVGVVALVGAAIAFLLVAPPTDFIRDQLVAQVKANTGRDLTIKGDAGLTFYPALDTAEVMVPEILSAEDPDIFLGLTHVGFAPYGDEVDSDLLIAENVPGLDVIIGGHSHTQLDPAVMVTSDLNPEGTLIAHARRYAGFLGQVNVGFIGDEIVLREGYLIPSTEAADSPDPALEAYLAPYAAEIDTYNETVIGDTEVPIDALEAYTEETNGANLQADSAIWELANNAGVTVDMHLSGAMSNRLVAEGATAALPVELTKGDMFNLMPYENSLVVLEMTGAQIKTVLERSYRNWWWFNQGYPWGDYSHYTTCMLATDAGNVITYTGDLATEPDGNNVASLTLEGVPVDLSDTTTLYNVSTVNYVAAGSCNFNDLGETIWPLDQITHDTQLYVRDSVINYVEAQTGPIAPAVEGRLVFPTP